MPALLIGLAVLIVILLGGQLFASANPKKLSGASRAIGGVAVLAAAAFLGARGIMALAIPLGLAGFGLLGLAPFGLAGLGARTQKSKGQTSYVRSAFVEMELDHDSGAMRGRILAGPHEGTSLDALPVATLAVLLPDIDEESRALLMAYLDRREPRWKEHAGPNPGTGQAKMSEEEAYKILGLGPGASAEEIGQAHRALMKKFHPDQGGSTYLAARINEAKDTLLRRYRT